MANIDVWITAGQSNMLGVGVAAEAPVPDPALCWEWDNVPDGIVPLVDPGDSASSYKAQTGSCLPRFAQQITASTARPSLMVRTAIGGTALLAVNTNANGNWSPTGTLFGNAVNRALAAINAATTAGHTIAGVHVLWDQGGTDAYKGLELGTYQAAMEALLGRFRTALSRPTLKMYVSRMGHVTGLGGNSIDGAQKPNFDIVRNAQDAACANVVGMEMAYTDAVNFPAWGWMRFDGMHYTQNGYNAQGVGLADFVIDDLGFAPPPPAEPEVPVSLVARKLAGARPVAPVYSGGAAGEYPFVVPDGYTTATTTAEGGGGGGGGVAGLGTGIGGGGGGGAYAAGTVAITPGETLTRVVGAAGTAGTSSTTTGGAGGPSGLKRGSTWLIRAEPGQGGLRQDGNVTVAGGAAGLAANCVGTTTTSGTPGADGGANGTPRGAGGAGAAPLGGAGGAAQTVSPGDGLPGTAPGGGGSGGRGQSRPGGAGGAGSSTVTLS